MATLVDRVEFAEAAELKELGDMPIDQVMAIMDGEDLDYRQLYYQWEHQQWEAGAIDFSHDRRQWIEDFSPELRRSFLWGLSSFYAGDEQATNALVPFVDAAPSAEHAVFLTTQLADAARHTVFFDRFYSEVDERGSDLESGLERQAGLHNTGFPTLLLEMLTEAAKRIRRGRGSAAALIEGVVLYHIVIEATLALTGQRFLLNYTRAEGLLPGFRQGLTAVARDTSRHVNFGVRFLREMVERDRNNAQIIQGTLMRVVPVALTVIEPPGGDMSYFDPLPYGPDDLTAFANSSLEKRLRFIGVEPAA